MECNPATASSDSRFSEINQTEYKKVKSLLKRRSNKCAGFLVSVLIPERISINVVSFIHRKIEKNSIDEVQAKKGG